MNKIQIQFLALLAAMLMGTGTAYAATDYGICVGETMVTSSNASDILGNGQFSYNASTKTLTVTNANLTNTGSRGSGIRNDEVDGFIIRLVGTSTLNTRMNCINSDKNFSIIGSGTLNATSSSGHGLALFSENTAVTCTINGPTINLTASSGSAVYDPYCTATLSFKGADTRVTLNSASNKQTVYNLKKLTVSDGLSIVHPQSATFNSSLNTVASNGTACKGTVAIGITYGLYIGETMVTSYNYDDVNGDGMFAYRPNTKTLDVRSGSFTNTGAIGSGIDNREVDGLTIHLTGSLINITARNAAVYSAKSFSITGPGTLNATSNSGSGMMFGGSAAKTCTIAEDKNGKSPTLNLKGNTYGIYDYNNNTTLNVKGTATILTLLPGTGYAAVNNLKDLTMYNGLAIVTPSAPLVGFYPALKSISLNGSDVYKGKVEIAYDYGIYVGETKVSRINYNDILGDGKFQYYPGSKELYLRSANLNNQGAFGSGIDNRSVDGLSIYLSGTSTIKARLDAITSCQSFSIKGSGTLNAISQKGSAISFYGATSKTCTIDGPKLNFSSEGYYGLNDVSSNTTLIVNGTTTNVALEDKSGYYPTVYGLNSLRMGSGIGIHEPTWASFDSSLKSIKDYRASEAYKGKIQIGVCYPLYIAGKTVSIMNASGITGDGISGTVTYNASTKSLTLRNATITTGDNFNPIQNKIDGLNIIVEGTNNIGCTGNGHQLLCIDASTKISGSGTLNLKTSDRNYCARVFDGSTLTIDGPTVNGSTKIEAFAFYPGNSESLVINGSSTKVTLNPGEGRAAIKDLTNFTLGSGLYITEPIGGKYSSSVKSITTDGTTPYSGEVVISREPPSYNIRIGTTMVTPENANNILGNGQFKYNPSTNTLTLSNVNYTQTNGSGIPPIRLGIEGLKVNVVGTNSITSDTYVIAINKSLTFTGTGSLTVTTDTDAAVSGISLWSGEGSENPHTINCTFDGPKVTIITPSGSAFSASSYDNNAIILKGSTTMLDMQPMTTDGIGTLYLIDDFRIESDKLYYLEPTGVRFDTVKKQFTVDGQNKYYGRVVVGPEIDYGFFVGETRVKTHNVNDILGDGCFSYDPASKTLTVSNANLENDGGYGSGISNREVDGLTINLVGDNVFKTRMAAIDSKETLYITGTGTLTAKSTTYNALYLWGERMMCTIDGPTIDFTGMKHAISDYFPGTTMFINGKNTRVSFQAGNGNETVEKLDYFGLDDGLSITPNSVRYDQTLRSFTEDGINLYRGKVVISSVSSDEYFSENNEDSVSVSYHITGDNTVEVGAQSGTAVSDDATEVAIPETVGDYIVTAIAAGAFEWNNSLNTVYLPATIETIGYGAFSGCGNLFNVYIRSRKAPTLLGVDGAPVDDNGAFAGLPTAMPGDGTFAARSLGNGVLDDQLDGATLHVPDGCLDEYNKSPWNYWFTNILPDATKQGDVNGDFSVDVADIASVIDVMASGKFSQAADVNNDGTVDVADIAAVIDIMAANARLQKEMTEE